MANQAREAEMAENAEDEDTHDQTMESVDAGLGWIVVDKKLPTGRFQVVATRRTGEFVMETYLEDNAGWHVAAIASLDREAAFRLIGLLQSSASSARLLAVVG